jgi:hypothetical protein
MASSTLPLESRTAEQSLSPYVLAICLSATGARRRPRGKKIVRVVVAMFASHGSTGNNPGDNSRDDLRRVEGGPIKPGTRENDVTDDSQTAEPAALYVYVAPPIDLWFGWKNLEKVPSDVMFPDDSSYSLMYGRLRKEWRAEVDRLLFQGRKYAQDHLGYAGDIDRGPFLSMVPGHAQAIPIVAWVSGDRDMTYVASPVPLPHLETLRSEVDEIRAAPAIDKDEGPIGRSVFRRED